MDLSILLFIQSLRTTITDILFTIITHLGDLAIVWIIILSALFIQKKTRYIAIGGVIALAVCTLVVNFGIKPLVSRPRPFVDYPIDLIISTPSETSFPSGHAASSFTIAVYLYMWNVKYKKSYLVLASLIAFSRLYVFVHYPSDVLAGILIGALIGYLTYKVYKKRAPLLWK